MTVANASRSIAYNQRDLVRKSSVTPTQPGYQNNHQHHHQHQLHHSYTLHSLEPKPLKPFKSQNAYIEAMKEDLAEWLNSIYADLELTPDNFFSQLETGAIICRHANNVTQMGRMMIERATANSDAASSGSDNDSSLNQETNPNHASLSSPSPEQESAQPLGSDRSRPNNQFYQCHRHSTTSSSTSSITTTCSSTSKQRLSLTGSSLGSPKSSDKIINWFRVKLLTFKPDARPGTFFARDNICQFILWCRSLSILECLLFETDDLVARKNEKSFILCLLEVARIGFKVGMPTPLIIQLEQEIDREIENDAKLQRQLEEEAGQENGIRRQNKDDSQAYLSDDCEDSNNNGENEVGGGDLATQDERQLELNNNKHDAVDEPAAEVAGSAVEQDKEDGHCEEDFGPKPQVITNDLLSLHERVSNTATSSNRWSE